MEKSPQEQFREWVEANSKLEALVDFSHRLDAVETRVTEVMSDTEELANLLKLISYEVDDYDKREGVDRMEQADITIARIGGLFAGFDRLISRYAGGK